MPNNNTDPVVHPGSYIRKSVLPAGISIKKAAEMLGVGRPALSNLVNGHASLSSEMALRLEKAFRTTSESLLQMQASYDKAQMRDRRREIEVRPYAPGFLQITATQIVTWSNQIDARSLLPVLLRRLVYSTGTNLTKVDFPAYDNAQRHGWDGQVKTETAMPWIPSGLSGWEFGCNKEPKRKAEGDYQARVASISAVERRDITFVFVTPRNWTGKDKWEESKRAKNQWKDVRAFDASDIEQWLEQSVPAQCWMAERLGVASDGILSLDECWYKWAKITEPELSKDLFRGSIDGYADKLLLWLDQAPVQPFVITADSEEEALAFVACAFESIGAPPGHFYDRAIVLRTADALNRVAAVSSNFIAIISSPEVENDLAGLHKSQHTIIIRRCNAVEGSPDIALGLLDDQTFKVALGGMGIEDDDVERYARESGQSPTILRRRLSVVQAIKFPLWAQDSSLAHKLIPMSFVGVWKADTKADQEILALLARRSYQTVEEDVAELLQTEQVPVWTVGKHRGVVSKIDALYAVHRFVTRQDLEHFFFTARYVLSEKDPALDLPEDRRWIANLYGKTRDHSAVLRRGICETLVLLAVHGKNLFQSRLGIDVEAHVNMVVHELLTPLNAETWASQQNDLPRYAEAAPHKFLDILESDLGGDDPQILTLLAPARGGLFGHCSRSGLLWALEVLAWNPERVLRVAYILARLSQQKIDDNWANTPQNTLASIFRSWIPQTAANVEERTTALNALTKRYPEIGWALCIEQFGQDFQTGQYSCRPHWRNDATGAGRPVTRGEDYKTRRKALDIVLDWHSHDEQTLGDLVERLDGIPDEDQEKVWTHIRSWSVSGPSDECKATLRETIRRYAFTRRGRKRNLTDTTRSIATEVYNLLEPKDEVVRHQWLFAKQWVDESLDELEDEAIDLKRREEKIGRLRHEALRRIWEAYGFDGVLRLCYSGDASNVIGWLLASIVGEEGSTEDVLYRLVSESPQRSEAKVNDCLAGFLRQLAADRRDEILMRLIKRFAENDELGADKTIRVLKCAPFRKSTWKLVDGLSTNLSTRYWTDVSPQWEGHEPAELNELIDRLVAVRRPKAAFHVVHMDWEEIDTVRLIRLLREVATSHSESARYYRFSSHDISEAFETLEKRPDTGHDELAQLEFIYIKALEGSRHGIPNLERQISESPNLFMQAVALTYKRSDDGEDPPEWLLPNPDAADSIVTHTHTLLNNVKRIPGTRVDDTIDVDELNAWIAEVRTLSRIHAREKVGDHAIGNLLAQCHVGLDGVWPCEPVRQALEQTGSKDIADGMARGVYNSRGAVWRGEGGEQERELAAKYHDWSNDIAFSFPFVARLLEEIACGYDRDAEWHDTDANIRKRLRY